MNRRTLVIASTLALLLAGCASGPGAQPDRISVPANGQLGVVVLIDRQPVHAHVGTTVFNNFTNPIEQDWQVEDFAMRVIESELEGKVTAVKLINTKILSDTIKRRDGTMHHGWLGITIRDDVRAELNRLARENNLFAVVVIENVEASIGGTAISEKGYGVSTRCALGFCRAEYLDHVAVQVSSIPVTDEYLLWGRGFDEDRRIKLDLSDGVKSVPEKDLSEAKNRFLAILEKRIRDALSRAGI